MSSQKLNTFQALDGNGSAQISTGPIVPGFTGTLIHVAGCLNNPFDGATNPIEIEIVP